MLVITAPHVDIAAVDVALQLEADIAAASFWQARHRTDDPSEKAAYALDAWLVTHPDEVGKAADVYPDWPAQFAAIKAAHTMPEEGDR